MLGADLVFQTPFVGEISRKAGHTLACAPDAERLLRAGEMVLIPKGEVHGTYNPHPEPVIFLAILSPAKAEEPGTVDVSSEEPWASLRRGLPICR